MSCLKKNDAWSRSLMLELGQYTFVCLMQWMVRVDSHCSPRSSPDVSTQCCSLCSHTIVVQSLPGRQLKQQPLRQDNCYRLC